MTEERHIRVQSTADLRDVAQRDELLRQAMSAVHGSADVDEQKARMRDAGYADWEIAEELYGRAEAADSLRSYDNIEPDYFVRHADKAIELRNPQIVARDSQTLRAQAIARSVNGKTISGNSDTSSQQAKAVNKDKPSAVKGKQKNTIAGWAKEAREHTSGSKKQTEQQKQSGPKR